MTSEISCIVINKICKSNQYTVVTHICLSKEMHIARSVSLNLCHHNMYLALQLNCFITFRCTSQSNMNLFFVCQKETVRIGVGHVTGAREPITREELVSGWCHLYPSMLVDVTTTVRICSWKGTISDVLYSNCSVGGHLSAT